MSRGTWFVVAALAAALTPSAAAADSPVELATNLDGPSRAEESRLRADEASRDRGGVVADEEGKDEPKLIGPKTNNIFDQIEDLGTAVEKPKQKKPTVPDDGWSSTGPCRVVPAGGWMQPVQGVYQDDPVFPTVEFGGKPLPNPVLHEQQRPGWYLARLPMVVGRDTVLMGVEKYRSNKGVMRAGSHDNIVIHGMSNCTGRTGVKVKFRFSDSSGWRDYTTGVIDTAPLVGPAMAYPRKFSVTVPAEHGMPPQDVGPFKLAAGSYYLSAEVLKDDDEATGLSVVVTGEAYEMHPPVVQFVPVMLSHVTMSKEDVLAFETYARDLADASRRFIPDYYPLPPDGLPTFARPLLNLSDLSPRDPKYPALSELDLKQKLSARLATAASLGGADRVVAIVRSDKPFLSDYDRISQTSAGITLSTKVIVIAVGRDKTKYYLTGDPAPKPGSLEHLEPVTLPYPRKKLKPGEILPLDEPRPLVSDLKVSSDIVDSVAHEIAHSLPDYLWSGDRDTRHNMLKSCGIDFHNKSDENRAYGERIVLGGYASERRREDGKVPILGPSTLEETWVTQCTYAHLLGAMLKKPDPPLLLVPVSLSRTDAKPTVVLFPFYDVMGVADVTAGRTKDWAAVVRDAAGGVLATYPFNPGWETATGAERDDAFVLLHLPRLEKAGTIEIAFAGKAVASRRIASAPPSLEVSTTTGASAGAVHVSWTAKGAGEAPLLSTVLYSSDGGRLFNDQVFEQPVSAADVVLDPKAASHFVKIVVTDGGRSSESTVRISAAR